MNRQLDRHIAEILSLATLIARPNPDSARAG